jgi:hypothetical protein
MDRASQTCGRPKEETYGRENDTVTRRASQRVMAFGCYLRTASAYATQTNSGNQQRVSTLLYLEPDHGVVIVLPRNLEQHAFEPLAERGRAGDL